MSKRDDTELSRRDDWFHSMYARHAQDTRRFVRRLGIPADELDDALQDVFLVVHRRWQVISDANEMARVLRGIAVRVCQNRKRSRWRNSLRWNRLGPETDPDTLISPNARPPDEQVARNEAQKAALRAVQKLGDEYREIFCLNALLQFTANEVAELVRMPRHAVAYRLRVARHQLDRELTRTARVQELADFCEIVNQISDL